MRNRIYELHKNMIAVSAACSRKENTQETADDRKNAAVTYNFATGDTVTIELEEGTEVAVYITESKRLEENEARRIRYNERHLDTGCDHGDWNSFVDPETDELYQKEKERSLREAEAARKAMDSLSAKQKELVMMLYGPEPITVSEYAAREGVSQPAISNRLKKIRKKLEKFL